MKNIRNVFDELKEGFKALAAQRSGKRALRTHVARPKFPPKSKSAK